MNKIEIKTPIINKTPEAIKEGQLCYVETKQLHVFIWGKFRKYRWYHRLFLKTPIKVGIIKGIDTGSFKKGNRLFLDLDNAGGLIQH